MILFLHFKDEEKHVQRETDLVKVTWRVSESRESISLILFQITHAYVWLGLIHIPTRSTFCFKSSSLGAVLTIVCIRNQTICDFITDVTVIIL